MKHVTDYTGFSSNPDEQEGYYLALNFSDNDFSQFTRFEVGLDPSYGSGLVDIMNDPDKNGVFKITNRSQKFVISANDGTTGKSKRYNLDHLNFAE